MFEFITWIASWTLLWVAMSTAEILASAKKIRPRLAYKLTSYAAFAVIAATSFYPQRTENGKRYWLGGLVYRDVPTPEATP